MRLFDTAGNGVRSRFAAADETDARRRHRDKFGAEPETVREFRYPDGPALVEYWDEARVTRWTNGK